MFRSTLLLLTVGLILALPAAATTPPNLGRTLEAQLELAAERPDDAIVLNDLGNLLVLADRLEEAENAYRQALAVDPDFTSAHFNLAILLQQIGRAREAEEALEVLLALDPHHAWGHYQLGVVLHQRDQRAAALEHYARALAYDPTLSFADNNPHIIENPLFAEALLISQRYRESSARRVARHYGDPERIVGLMLEEEEEEGREGEEGGEEESIEESEDEEEPVASGRPVRGPRPRPRADFSEGPDDAGPAERETPGRRPAGRSGEPEVPAPAPVTTGGRRVIDQGTLETEIRRDRGETPGSSRVRERPSAGVPAPATPLTIESDGQSGRRTIVAPGRRDLEPDGTVAPPAVAPPAVAPPRSRYIPARRSTAQLELKLLPPEEPT